MGKASNRKVLRRAGGGSADIEKPSRERARLEADLCKAIVEDDVDLFESAAQGLARLGKHYIFDVDCTIAYSDGSEEVHSVVRGAIENEAFEVCGFLMGAMSNHPDSALYKSMVDAAVKGLDWPTTDGKRAIYKTWAEWVFEEAKPEAMTPDQREAYCQDFGPNAARLWWEMTASRISEAESRELQAAILSPAGSGSRVRTPARL
jgi:hypothetical protein